MLEQMYFQLYETEMLAGEIKRAAHFLERAAYGKGFYARVAAVLLDSIKSNREPEEAERRVMEIEGDEMEKKAIFFRFLYSYNRYDISFPKYDSKRCKDR